MVGSPYQTDETIAKDLLFLKDLNPQMVGIGPFIPHKDTQFKDFVSGSVEKTLFLLLSFSKREAFYRRGKNGGNQHAQYPPKPVADV